MSRILLLAAALLALASPAAAQRRADLASPLASAARAEVPLAAGHGVEAEAGAGIDAGALVARGLLGALGWVGGAAVGAVASVPFGGCLLCGAEGDGEGTLLAGMAIGGVLGSGMMAAVPGLGSRCGHGGRVRRGIGGAALGALAGLAFGVVGEEGAVAMIPFTTTLGAAVGAGC